MAQKFVSLDEAATQLGISKDRLNELREDGNVRAYRDGTSWKFRVEDVEKLAAEGMPPAGSDISLEIDEPSDVSAAAATSDIELDLGDDDLAPSASVSDLGLDFGDEELPASAATSDIALEDLDEPTVPAESTDEAEGEVLSLGGVDEIDEFSDSILLSETELGHSTDRPPSTIIGKAEMAADLDLDLVPADDASASDVKLASAESNVFSPESRGDVFDAEPPSLSDNFGDLDELEIDLEAESSRILSPEDVSQAQQAAISKAAAKATEMSDLELAVSDSDVSPGAGSRAGDSALAGLSALELDSDDEVLGDGSDITLSGESSGINIISPSDSGLALDEVPLELGSGSPIASSLDLGPTSGADVGLEPLETAEEDAEGEPFALTPFGEEAAEEEADDSSQIIPLDEVSEDDALLGVAATRATPDSLGDEFGVMPGGGMMPVSEAAADTPFPGWVVALLSFCMVTLALGGMMAFDLVRNIWSWDGVYSLNSKLMDVLTPILG